MNRGQGATLFAFGLLAPAILYILVIVAYPLVETVNLSFTDAALKPTTNWVGMGQLQEDLRRQFRRDHPPHLRVDLLLGV